MPRRFVDFVYCGEFSQFCAAPEQRIQSSFHPFPLGDVLCCTVDTHNTFLTFIPLGETVISHPSYLPIFSDDTIFADDLLVGAKSPHSPLDDRHVLRAREVIKAHRPQMAKTYYFQSKNPRALDQYIGEYPEGSILLTTLETNRDAGYGEVSRAPVPSQRFADFHALDYPRKAVTVEPVMDFDLEPFTDWMLRLRDQGTLEYVWFGFNSKPGQVRLPEPSTEKAQRFVDRLIEAGIEVKGKSLRGVEIG